MVSNVAESVMSNQRKITTEGNKCSLDHFLLCVFIRLSDFEK